MNELWKKSSLQVYLHGISHRETDSYKGFLSHSGFVFAVAKIGKKSEFGK
jgi:hypothetical protein